MGANDTLEMLESALEENIRLEADNGRLEARAESDRHEIVRLRQVIIRLNDQIKGPLCGIHGTVGQNAAHRCICSMPDSQVHDFHVCGCGVTW